MQKVEEEKDNTPTERYCSFCNVERASMQVFVGFEGRWSKVDICEECKVLKHYERAMLYWQSLLVRAYVLGKKE